MQKFSVTRTILIAVGTFIAFIASPIGGLANACSEQTLRILLPPIKTQPNTGFDALKRQHDRNVFLLAEEKPRDSITRANQRTSIIPYFTVSFDQFLVHAYFGKRQGGDFIIDTGSSINAISDKMVANLKLSTQPVIENGNPVLYGGRPGRFVTIPSMQIGQLQLINTQFLVLNSANLSAASPIDGVIAITDLASYTVLFDPPARQIKVWIPGGVTPELLKSEGFDPAAFVSIEKYKNSATYATPVTFQTDAGSETEELVIDTGSDGTRISSTLAAKLKLVPYENLKYASPLVGISEESVAHMPTLIVGDQIETKTDVHYTSLDSLATPPILGMDVLGGYRMLFDFAGGKLYLNPWVVIHRHPAKAVPQSSSTPVSSPAPAVSSP